MLKNLQKAATFPRFKVSNALKQSSENFPAAVYGRVKNVRQHKKVTFLDIDDGSHPYPLQVVVKNDQLNNEIKNKSSVCVEGKVIKTPKHVNGVEMVCENLNVIGTVNPKKYPNFHDKTKEVGFFRNWPNFRVRENPMRHVLPVRSCLEFQIHKYFQENGYIHVHTPLITSNSCEGGSETFEVQSRYTSMRDKKGFFDKKVNLTVSGQLHLESVAMSHTDVYTLGPCFRAEPSTDRTHLAEFHMLEVERAFCGSQEDIMELMENSIKSISKATLDKCSGDIEILHNFYNIEDEYKKSIDSLCNEQYLRMTYTEAVKILKENKDKLKTKYPCWGADLNAEQESYLTKHVGNRPVFVTDFPKILKPFYAFANDDGRTAAAVDLLVPSCGELCGGTVREHRIDQLEASIQFNYDLQWYCDTMTQGGCPHSGYGMGFDRLVRFLCGVTNIREARPFPRAYKSCLL